MRYSVSAGGRCAWLPLLELLAQRVEGALVVLGEKQSEGVLDLRTHLAVCVGLCVIVLFLACSAEALSEGLVFVVVLCLAARAGLSGRRAARQCGSSAAGRVTSARRAA